MHDFLTVGAPAPLQTAAAVGFAFDADYYNHFTADYKARRDFLCGVLREAGFEFAMPEGAYSPSSTPSAEKTRIGSFGR